MAGIHEVAKRAGVSITTVSRVLNDYPQVSEKTRANVLRAVQELNYIPNASARSLVLGRSQLIALIVPDIANPFYARLAKGVQSVCDENDVSVLICSTDGSKEKEKRVFESLTRKTIDGICVVRYLLDDSTIRRAANLNVPVVVIGSRPKDLTLDNVGIFGTGTALQALLEPVVRQGKTRVALLAGPEESLVGWVRTRIYLQTLERMHIQPEKRLIAAGNFTFQGGYRAMHDLLSSGAEIDAVFAANDLMAVGAMRALEEKGYVVGEDVAVIGCDDIDLAELVKPSLSTVRLPTYELGAQGAELLLRRIKDPDAPVRERALEARPIARASTASLTVRA